MRKGIRKLVVAILALALGFILALVGKLGGEFVQIAVTALTTFAAANAFEHHKNGGNGA